MKSRHFARFKVLYLQALVSVAAAVAGELGPLKDVPPEKVAAYTWIFWAFMLANVVVSAGNTIVASLHPPPEPKAPNPNAPPPLHAPAPPPPAP